MQRPILREPEAFAPAQSAGQPWRPVPAGDAIIIDFPKSRAAPPLRDLIETLYRQHNESLVRFLRSRLRNEADAREAAQEAFVRLLQQSDVRQPAFLKAYLFTVAANVATDLIRRRLIRAGAAEAQDERSEGLQERSVIAREALRAVSKALEQLPHGCREAFDLNRQHGWSTLRIARHLGITDRTVRRHLARALQHLHNAVRNDATDQSALPTGARISRTPAASTIC